MNLTGAQISALEHLRSAYRGPEGGENEVIFNGRPDLQYSVGILFPSESTKSANAAAAVSDSDQSKLSDDLASDVPFGEIEENSASLPLSEDWRPSSVAISLVTDNPALTASFSCGTYSQLEVDGPPQWLRTDFTFEELQLAPGAPPVKLQANSVEFEVGSRWRSIDGAHLVTVHARILSSTTGSPKLDAGLCLYQTELSVEPTDSGSILEYFSTSRMDTDAEAGELRLRYRNRRTFAAGHGMAAEWDLDGDRCTRVYTNPVPAYVVPAVETVAFSPDSPEGRALNLKYLSLIDSDRESVTNALDSFVGAFGEWVKSQESRVASFQKDAGLAQSIVGRSKVAYERMHAAVNLLRAPDQDELRLAFALAMAAMRIQMRQTRINEGADLASIDEPAWRPFQLGFILVSLPSTVIDDHPDRELVDLIWFPTGGGKTEAYLGLASIEIFRRRLAYGLAGGGTAILTRYTLRLLTAQQFHRTAALICAMELLRREGGISDRRARGMAPFSIGLWVGNEVTPGSRRDAKVALERLLKAARPDEANGFQVESCPWCSAALVPSRRSADSRNYGFRLVGRDVVIHCTRNECEFHDELPVLVTDEDLYESPPTVLLATVDKFARLQFNPSAGRLLGLNTANRAPSLIIQDELHLLSGPLGTTVAVFDSVLQLLLGNEASPKIVASTATIRASQEQVQGLYGRDVALYPPSGLDDDRTFFSKPVRSGEGRLYIGMMPQSFSQASSVVAAVSPLMELPGVVHELSDGTRDAYWTAVLYHNSLRELGRTGTLVIDDVNARLQARSSRLGLLARQIRPDRVIELTSRRGPEELPNDLRELGLSIEKTERAVDVVLSSNMLSVGIDVPRLALMLMVGQPKTSAEYIQATSRVGRGSARGVVVTLFRSNRARDRSHFETFRSYHDSLYRSVEPTSVTPWSRASRERSLAGALVMLLRQKFGELSLNEAAVTLDLANLIQAESVTSAVEQLKQRIRRSDPIEADSSASHLDLLLRQWDRRSSEARSTSSSLSYDRVKTDPSLFKRFGQPGEGWLVADSMRSVEPNVAIEVREPQEDIN